MKRVSKRYGKTYALKNIDLSIGKGLFGLLGPNGAGKTTLMRILVTLLKPTEGEVTVNGLSLTKKPDAVREQIGYLPQTFHLYPHLTGREFLDYVAVMKGINAKRERTKVIDELLEQVNLTDKSRRKIKTYSGGMRQRLGIAQALLGDPHVLVVDEPTAGLDPEERVRFRNLLSQISVNRVVILSTHIVADIESSCNRLAVMDRGRVVTTGTLADLRHEAEGIVWEITASDEEYAALESHVKIVSTRRTDTGIQLKVIARDNPLGRGTPLKPTLEDGYMALLGGTSHA
ncbi:ABC transporter ATP-binding protein [Numidum massiliense]|uniref:ABC transporter ATP-binding protein n=1 Tax=Numidum massiliense TaxID=1522315 RepID=UPI0028FCF432|nr:ABC transporter ATP-binding protein [Numidum massiliense]